MVRVPNRTKDVIDYLLETRLNLGSILLTDYAKVYDNIHKRLDWIDHDSVNHSRNFLNPKNAVVNTHMIESRWGALKQKIKSIKNTNYMESCIAQYLYEFEYLYPLKERSSYGKQVQKLISDIARVYVSLDPSKISLELLVDGI